MSERGINGAYFPPRGIYTNASVSSRYFDEEEAVASHVYAWNPKLWNWPELARERRVIDRRGHVDIEWACGRNRAIEVGSRAFFVRLGIPPKGLFGSGYALSTPREDIHWLDEKAQQGVRTNYVKLRLDALFQTPLITLDELAQPPFRRFRWAVRQSGMRLPSSIADALEPWWEARVADAREARAASARKRAPSATRGG